MQMQLSSVAQIPDGMLAAIALRNEKPRLGVPSWNPALHQGIDASNSTIVLGLQSTAALNRIGSRSTGKERDAESGLDYFGARYYASNMGRMMSPDPSGLAYADPTNPQSFNLYAYVMNNPLSNTDPDGLSCVQGSVDNGDGTSTTVYSDDGDGKGCAAAGINPDGSETTKTIQAYVNTNGDDAGTSSSGLGDFLSNAGDVISTVGGQAFDWLAAPRDPGCLAGFAAGGAAYGVVGGGIVGGIAGAGGGTLVAPGVGTVGGGFAGATEGASIGGQAGFVGGTAVGFILCAKGSGPGFGGNQRENKMANDAKKDAERQTGKKFTKALDRVFHDEITGQGINDYHELVKIAVDVLQGHI